MFTFEGRIDQMGNFRPLGQPPTRWRRTLGKLVFVLPLPAIVVTLAVYAVMLIASAL